MKVIRTIALIFAALVISVFLYSFFLPSEYNVERKIRITADKQIVFRYINNLRLWQEWSTWTSKQDSTIKFSYKGPETGTGSIQYWSSKRMGKGNIKITKSIEFGFIECQLNFEDNISKGQFLLKQNNFGTEIKWEVKGNAGWNPIAKIFSYFYMDSFMGPDLERALKNLKIMVESRKSLVESLKSKSKVEIESRKSVVESRKSKSKVESRKSKSKVESRKSKSKVESRKSKSKVESRKSKSKVESRQLKEIN